MRHLCEHTLLTHLTTFTKYTCGLSIGINVLPDFWHIIWVCGLSTSAAYSQDFTVTYVNQLVSELVIGCYFIYNNFYDLLWQSYDEVMTNLWRYYDQLMIFRKPVPYLFIDSITLRSCTVKLICLKDEIFHFFLSAVHSMQQTCLYYYCISKFVA